MILVSYAQNNEDIILWRALSHIEGGFYVDVGANDPKDDSITKLFYDRGWRGINIEPSPEYFARLQDQRPGDINLACAVGDRDGTTTFYDANTRGWSTSDPVVGEHYVSGAQATKRQVPLLKLDGILECNHLEQIHFLKIDVEGAEASVLNGLGLDRFRPWILLVESLDPVSQAPRFSEWEPQVLSHDYGFVYFDGLNRYYLAAEHADLAPAFDTPPNVLDEFVPSVQVDLQARIHGVEGELLALTAELAESRNSLQALTADLGESRKHANILTADLAKSREKADALTVDLSELNKVRIATESSLSWRITRPLRELNRIRNDGSSFSKTNARKLLAKAALGLDRFPYARKTLVRIITKFPNVNYRLRSALATHRRGDSLERNLIVISDLIDTDRAPSNGKDVIVLPQPAGKRILYVYVDHTVKCPVNTGVQRVTRGLANSLKKRGECVRYVKWNSTSGQCLLINASERAHLARWNGPAIDENDGDIYPLDSQPQIPIGSHLWGENHWLIVPEVPHITYQEQPVTLDLLQWSRRVGLKSGFVFYDAIPLRRDELRDMSPKHVRYMQELLLADVVWPISEWSANDLISYWVAHEHAESSTMPSVQTISLSGESLLCERVREVEAGEEFILSVGSIEPRKNQIQLIRAFESYCKQHSGTTWRLLLVGNLHPLVADEVVLATRSKSAIKHLGHISDQDLDKLYRSCAFTVFPSIEEGFGLPILESLWYGKPCVCANFGAMVEVAGDGGCLTLDTREPLALEQAITRLIEDEEYRHVLSEQAVRRPIKTWDEYAGGIGDCIDEQGRVSSTVGLLYYWIDATLQFPKNTGIQRVSRQLARAFMETGMRLIPVKWDPNRGQFVSVSEDELEFFAKWNGPEKSMWHDWVPPSQSEQNSWFFMPDLPLNRSTDDRKQLLQFARKMGLRCAAVFYDAIPWKMRKIYPPHFSEAHSQYMIGLGEYDLVLPISSYSKDDLVDFLGKELARPQSLDSNIKTVSLPGEFSESQRVSKYIVRTAAPIRVLCVGTVEPRKNHEVLLKAFKLATSRGECDIRLVIAGGAHSIDPTLAGRIRNFIDQHSAVEWEENADDTRLRELHMECDFTIYPSVEEGFGLPILESLWYAKPCICANFGAMLEVAEGGGCFTVDVRNAEALAEALQQMAEDPLLREKLSQEAVNRVFKSWQDYALEVAGRLAQATPRTQHGADTELQKEEIVTRALAMHLSSRPKLSVCISTFNRAEWLSVSLRNWARLYPDPLDGVELLVCDNTSTDHTPDVIKPYLHRTDFSYHRNKDNVGMLGNLRETAHHADGEYVWILGDDDLLMPESIERVLEAIRSQSGVALVYLNYAFTRIEDARTVKNFDDFFREATPIVPPEPDREGPIRAICSRNENFFTAIYTLVLRRDHALKAYSQDTSGRPFSTMPTCIPTTHYVLNHMMEELGVWIGSPQLVVNMNVSWLKYAPLWILERIPELYELAERRGVPSEEMDRWRRHTLVSFPHYFQEIFEDDPLNNAEYFSPARLVRRFKHLPEFAATLPILRAIYARAHAAGHPVANLSAARVFSSCDT